MRRTFCLILLACMTFGITPKPVVARTWKDRTTGRTLDAEFVGFADGKVEIKRARDGKTFHLPLERLSDDDQLFVRARTTKQNARAAAATPSQLLARFTTSELTSELLPKDGKLLLAPDQKNRLVDWERNVVIGKVSGPIIVTGSGYESIHLKQLDTHLGKCDKTTKEVVTEIVKFGEEGVKPAPLETYWYGPVGFSFAGDSLAAIFYRPEEPAGRKQPPVPANTNNLEGVAKTIHEGGTFWTAPTSAARGDRTFSPGERFWVWPTEDRVLEAEDGKLKVKFYWKLRPGQKQPQEMKDRFFANIDFLSEQGGGTMMNFYAQQIELKSKVSEGDLEFTFDATNFSGQGEVLFFLNDGPFNKPNSNLLRLKVSIPK